jgi:hypothetical protein
MQRIYGLFFGLLLLASMPITLAADNNSINGRCPGEVIEEIDGATSDASHTENGAIGGGGNDRYRMQFNVPGTLRIEARNRDIRRNARYYFYVSRNSCGNNDSDWNIVSAEFDRYHSSTVAIQAGDTIYVRLQSERSEPRNGAHRYALILDFTAQQGGTRWIKNSNNTEAHTDPAPYTNRADITETLSIDGATALDVTISGATERGYDYIYITDNQGNTQRFSGDLSETFTVQGSSITIRFTSDGSVVRDGVTVQIAEHPTTPPIIRPIPDQTANLNLSFQFDIKPYVQRTDGDPITAYHLDCSVPGLTFDPSSGILSGTPSQNGTYTCSATADDKDGTSDAQTFTLTVSDNIIQQGEYPFYLINPPETRNMIGNFAILGNTIECVTTSRNQFGAPCTNNRNFNDNGYMVKYIDIDNDARTWNSSSSNFTIPSSYDDTDGPGIVWAGLFWQGAVNNFTNNGNNIQRRAFLNNGSVNYFNITQNTAINIPQSGARHLLIKIDGDPDYAEVSSHTFFYDTFFPNNTGGYYAAFADITDLIRSKQLGAGQHTVTVANITTNEGRERWVGDYAGWSMVVIYKERGAQAKARNISIYNGYSIMVSPGDGNAATRVVKISGFRLPKTGEVNALFGAFAGEGEFVYGGGNSSTNGVPDYDRMVMSRNPDLSNPSTMPGATDPDNIFDAILANIDRDDIGDNRQNGNNNGIDVESYDVSSIMEAYRNQEQNISTVYIGLSTTRDYITPSMMAFSAELYMPKICYDYDLRIGEYIKIQPDNKQRREFHANKWGYLPLQLKTMIRSEEADFDLENTRLRAEFTPDAFTYRSGESKVSPDNINTYVDTIETDGSIGQIAIGEDYTATSNGGIIGADDNTYAKMFYDFNVDEFNGTFDLIINANITFVEGEQPTPYEFSTAVPPGSPGYLGQCDSNPVYDPIWGRFNVENDSGSSNMIERLPLRTQIAGKPYKVHFASYTKGASGRYDQLTSSNANIEFDLIDASTYENNASVGFDVTCEEPQPILRGGFVHFGGSSQVEIDPTSYPNYDKTIALHNVAFRIWVLSRKDPNSIHDTRIMVEHNCTQATDSNCFDTLYADVYQNHDDNETQYCSADCQSSSGRQCYDCLKKYFALPICSRDNFAIRPAGFRVVLGDTDEEEVSAPVNRVAKNVQGQADSNLSAEYRYQLKVEATTIDNHGEFNDPDYRAKAYYKRFQSDVAVNPVGTRLRQRGSVALLEFNGSLSSCYDINNTALNLVMQDGSTPDNDPTFVHDNVGQYRFWLVDGWWTRVDQGDYEFKPIFDPDCENNRLQDKCFDCAMPGINGGDIDKAGCVIRSSYADETQEVNATIYTDLNLTFMPYSIDVGSFGLTFVPDNNGYMFMSDLDYYSDLQTQSIDMSAIVNGHVIPRGKRGSQLTNFTDGCAASDIQLRIGTGDFNGTLQEYLQYGTMTNPIDDKATSLNGQAVTLNLSKRAFTDSNGTLPDDYNATDAPDANGTHLADLGPGSAKVWIYTTLKKLDKNATRILTGKTGINPQRIHYHDLNASGNNASSFAHMTTRIPTGSTGIDRNVTYLYARITPGQELYDYVQTDWKRTELYVNVYCDNDANCTDFGVTSAGRGDNDDPNNWHLADMFLSPSDIGKTDLETNTSEGVDASPKVAAETEGPDIRITDIGFGTPDVARQEDINVSVSGPGRPTTVKVFYQNDNTSPWLRYDPINDNNFYRVRFIGQYNWSGVGKTGKVTDTTSSHNTDRRMNW